MAEVTLVKAVNMALVRAMEEDGDVLVLGQDVAVNGGVFRATEGLFDRFGERRVRDTPARRAAHLRRVDRHGGARPQARVRDPVRGVHLPGAGPACEPRIEAPHPHPGPHDLPARAAHARRRRHPCPRAPFREHRGVPRPRARAQVRDPVDPGACLRAAALGHPRSRPGGVPRADAALPARQGSGRGRRARSPARAGLRRARRHRRHIGLLGRRDVGEPGRAARLEAEGASVELVDVSSITPFDEDTVLGSVRRTGRLVIVHEAPCTAGFGAEIAARVAERALDSLFAPIERVTGFDTVMPLPKLERDYLPGVERVVAALRRALGERLARLRLGPTRHVAPFLGSRASCPLEHTGGPSAGRPLPASGRVRAGHPRSQDPSHKTRLNCEDDGASRSPGGTARLAGSHGPVRPRPPDRRPGCGRPPAVSRTRR